MKPIKLISIITGLIILTGAGVSNTALAQTSRGTLPNTIDKIQTGQIIDHESDPKVEERNLRNEFRGIKLEPARFDKIKQARRQLRKELKQIMSSGLGGIAQLLFLPKKEADEKSIAIFGNPLVNYAKAISETLTPEELKIWQQNVEQGAKR